MRPEDYLRIWEEFLETRMEDEVLALADSYPDKRSLYVPFKLLERFNQEIADDLLDHPKQVLSAGNEVLRSIDLPMDVTLGNAFLRVISLPPTSRLKARNLREYHPGKFVALEGMVRMASKAFTAVTRVYVTCQRCGNGFMTSPARVKAGTIQCNNPACDRGGPYVKDIERSEKTAKRVIQLQENPEGLKGGELPETIGIILTGDLVEGISPGNRVVVNGIVMLREIKSKAGDTLDYEHYIDAVSVEVIEREFEEIDITPEDERAIRELSKSPTLIEDIRGSIAPTIYGQDDVKEAIALQLVSSPPVSHQDGTRTRGDIHILLVGDPGIAKSQILKYVIGLAPRGVFTSGKGSTAAGLTASAVKDEMSDGRWTIEAGALPMADMGLCAVDEMDKMQDNDRDALHEGLEQQTISVSKAGINATLRCRCSVLAAANPKLGRFDLIEPISSQIKLAPTLLSRFDLIFVLFDTPEQELDSRISSHILNVYMDDSVATPPIPPELLRKYIAYARRTITPQMTQESSKALQEYYLGVRAQYNSGPNQPVPTTARQLQALMRLSVASARLRLSNQVELQDANRAIALTDACLRKVDIDQNTGNYDAGAIDTGFTKTHVDAISTLKTIIRDICKNNNGIAPALDILKAATEAGLDEDRAQKVLERMRIGTEIMEPRPGYYRLV